jgi:hypothetical protein
VYVKRHKDKRLKFTSLLHHITEEPLRASFFELKKQATPGIDGETWRDYAIEFERRISDLHGQIRTDLCGGGRSAMTVPTAIEA